MTMKKGKERKDIMIYVLGAILVFVALAAGNIFIQNRKPQVELGVNEGRFHEIRTSPNCVSTQTSYEDKLVPTLAYKSSTEASKKAMKAAFEAYGAIEIMEETDTYIYAVATTGKMKYHDDIEVYFDEEAQQVHYRSASRAGYSDMGLNKARYEALAKAYMDQ